MTYPPMVTMKKRLIVKTLLSVRTRSLLTAAVLLLMSALTASADNAGLETASALMKAGDYAGAVMILRVEAEKAPEDPRIACSLGVALNRSGEGREAEAILKSALMTIPEDPAVNLELGILYYNKKISDEAAEYFERAVELAPDGPTGAEARTYLKKIAAVTLPKSWSLNLIAGIQYDSNVMVNGDNQPLPRGISRKSDWSAVVELGGSYRFLKTGRFEAAAGYSLYQNLHDRLSDFDVTQNLLNLSGTYFFSSDVKLSLAYNYEYLLLGGDQYDYANILEAALTNTDSRWGYSSFEYRYRDTVYRDSDLYADNEQRSGGNNTLTITHILPLGTLGSIRGSYALESDKTRHNYWDYTGNRVSLGIQANLPLKLTAAVTGEVYGKQYSADDPAYGTTRNDTQYSFGVSLTNRLSERYSVTLGELYLRNDSNIAPYDYSRSLTSLMLNVRL